MKCLLSVCLAVLTTEAAILAISGREQALQKGISVQMATSSHAVPMPEADRENAWIVTVTTDGQMYFGTEPVTAEGLKEAMRVTPRSREQNLYIKADARAPFASVRRAVEIARASLLEAPVLLTSQPQPAAPGKIVPPQGLEVISVPPASSGSGLTAVQISRSEHGASTLTVNDANVSWDALQSALKQTLQNQSTRVVVVKVGGRVPFAEVAHVIDVCRSVEARAALAAPEL